MIFKIMKQNTSLIKSILAFAGVTMLVVALITACFYKYQLHTETYIDQEMLGHLEQIQDNSIRLVQSQMNYLKNITTSMAKIMEKIDLETDEEIVEALKDYSDTANITYTLFITLDGHAYSNHAGYLGQNEENTVINDIPISDINAPIFSQPYYADSLEKNIFGVVVPVALGEKQGVLISSYNVDSFSELLNIQVLEEGTNISIIDSEGEIICDKDGVLIQKNVFQKLREVYFLEGSLETVQSDITQGKDGIFIYEQDDISLYCSYKSIGLNDWYILLEIREDYLSAKYSILKESGIKLVAELILIMLIVMGVFITKRMWEYQQARRSLEQQAMLDGLTKIYNRKTVEEKITQILYKLGEDTNAILLIIDIDDFKEFNDNYGHLFGDRVLRACADRLEKFFGNDGIIGRMGGDEFVVFLKECTNLSEIHQIICALKENFYVTSETGKSYKISLSIGLAQSGPGKNSFIQLYKTADAAMYGEKRRKIRKI